MLGLPPDIELELMDVDFHQEQIELPSIAELEELALLHRPELFGNDLQGDVLADEVRVNLIQTFPDIIPFIGQNYDSNHFLLFNHWYSLGIRGAIDLLGIPEKIQQMRLTQSQKELNNFNRLVLSLGILTQVHLAYSLYREQYKYYQTQERIFINTDFVRKAAEKMREYNAKGDLELIVTQGNAYQTQINSLNTFADFASSLEQLNNSIGLPGYLNPKPRKHSKEAQDLKVEDFAELENKVNDIKINEIKMLVVPETASTDKETTT